MKRFLTLLLTLCLFCAPACGKYQSKYDAVGLIRHNAGTEFSASFQKLDGTLVGKIQADDGQDGVIRCKASLEEGEITVYYDEGFNKFLLFSLKAGESIDDDRGYYSNGSRVYIIVEAVSCKGIFEISV